MRSLNRFSLEVCERKIKTSSNLVRFSNVSNQVHVGYETKIYFFIRVHLRCCLPIFLFFMLKITTELVPNER